MKHTKGPWRVLNLNKGAHMKFIIKDWANNICFKGRLFDTFEDAWGYIYENDPCSEEEDAGGYYSDYEVEEVTKWNTRKDLGEY